MWRRNFVLSILLGGATIAMVLSLSACSDNGDDKQPETHTVPSGAEFNDADTEFATDMVQHHAQALAMVDLTRGRELDPGVERLAEAIRMAQSPEIEQMTTWLTDWGQPIPETVRDHANAHGDGHGGSDADMPGMMSAEEMAELEAAQGSEFQQMWLEMMVEHHEGAIQMSKTEQEAGRFAPAIALAEQIATSQQKEIATILTLLAS